MTAEVSAVRLSMLADDIAAITFDAPDRSANILSQPVIAELARLFDEIERRTNLAGVVFRSAKPSMFIAGADIREFAAAEGATAESILAIADNGRKMFERLAAFPFVSVAAIDGICLGGGAELAIWCDRRIMSDGAKTQFGYPEVKLGLLPGLGGTVRTPRIVGLANAVEMITSGEAIDAQTSRLMGLVSDVTPADRLDAAAVALVRAEQASRAYLTDRERWSRPIAMSETELAFLGATAAAMIQDQTKGHYPAPVAALEHLLETASLDAAAAGPREAKLFAKLFGTPINRALINVFLLTDRNKKDTGVARGDIKPRAVRSVGVFGAGIMGGGIAAAAARRGMAVIVTDARPDALSSGMQKIIEEASFNKKLRGPDMREALRLTAQVKATAADADFSACDLVIEAIVENAEAKAELYRRIEPQLRPDAILASNTSAISIARLAQKLARPERFCGIHFFNPVRRMQLVEVIRGPKTSDETIASAVAFAKELGKSPIVVEDGPGFLVNRLLLPYMTEALELVLDGLPISAVDKAARGFGMPMGPITLYDVVGLDTALFAGRVMLEAFPDRVIESPLLAALVAAGRLGQKTSAGFFAYKPGKQRGAPDPKFDEILRPLVRAQTKLSSEQIVDRLFLPMVLEATRILDEKKVRDPRDVDLGLILGTGFPPFRGGLLYWADTLGAKKIIERLKPYEAIGERYRATPVLVEMAASGRAFYR